MVQERGGHTLQTTALVNEVYLKFANRDGLRAQNRAHFLALAARQMRCILVDYARGRARDKRGGEAQKVPLSKERSFVQVKIAPPKCSRSTTR